MIQRCSDFILAVASTKAPFSETGLRSAFSPSECGLYSMSVARLGLVPEDPSDANYPYVVQILHADVSPIWVRDTKTRLMDSKGM